MHIRLAAAMGSAIVGAGGLASLLAPAAPPTVARLDQLGPYAVTPSHVETRTIDLTEGMRETLYLARFPGVARPVTFSSLDARVQNPITPDTEFSYLEFREPAKHEGQYRGSLVPTHFEVRPSAEELFAEPYHFEFFGRRYRFEIE